MKLSFLALAAALVLASPAVMASDCSATVESNDAMKFNTSSLEVSKSCKSFTVTLKHTGKLAKNVMGHNLVISKTGDMAGVNADAMKAGIDNEYVKPGDSRVVAFSKIIGGGESTTMTFNPAKLDGADYSFFCSFPGHYALMKGSIKLIP